VFLRIRSANVTLSAKKCQFAAAELDYLGHHIGLGRVQPRMKKVEALLAYPIPVNRKQLPVVLSDLLKKGSRFNGLRKRTKLF